MYLKTYLSLLLVVVATTATPPLQIDIEPGSVISRFSSGLVGNRGQGSGIQADDASRLSTNFLPISYTIHTAPIIDAPAGQPFQRWENHGKVSILVSCAVATNVITLHAGEITILQADVQIFVEGDTTTNLFTTLDFEEEHHFLHLNVNAPLVVGTNYVININKYVGTVRDTTTISGPKVGLYQAEYTDPAGVQHWIATTQFETIGFRYFCPGFDEPSFKATFTIHIGRAPEYNSYANNALDGAAGQPDTTGFLPTGWVWDNYQTTAKTSSYLLALVVSKFSRQAAAEGLFRLPVGIIGPAHLVDGETGGVYAADESAKIMKAFEDIFQVGLEYPMNKMDSAAIPRDYFTFGAMENWGLNTYRDNLLLYYSKHSTEATRHQIASILAHELAHQWFGNRVTTAWWSNIWLNEGFATYFSYLGVSGTEPAYDAENQIGYDAVQSAMSFDATGGSHPVINTATKEEVATMSIFDTITYDKGASLIRMMESILGKDNLMGALRAYLKTNEYTGAFQEDLFTALDTFAAAQTPNPLPAGKTIQSIMETWTLQKGFPLVRVQRGNANTVYISQERYRNNQNAQGSETTELNPNELWEIPVAIATAATPAKFANPSPDLWINKNIALRTYAHAEANWLVVNPGAYGYYRVLYDTHYASLLQAQLVADDNVFPGAVKGQIIDDYFRFAEEGYIQYETALAFTKYLNTENDHTAWIPALNAFTRLSNQLLGSNVQLSEPFKKYLLPKVEAALNDPAIGWTQPAGQHGMRVLLRARLLDWACSLGSARCSQDAVASFKLFLELGSAADNPVPIDLRPVYYCAAIAAGDSTDFNRTLARYTESHSNNHLINDERIRLLRGLACTQDNLSLDLLVRDALRAEGDSQILKAHTRELLARVGTYSEHGRELVYGVLTDAWRELSAANGGVGFLASVVESLVANQNTPADYQRVVALETKLISDSVSDYIVIADRLYAARNRIAANLNWGNNLAAPLARWFTANTA